MDIQKKFFKYIKYIEEKDIENIKRLLKKLKTDPSFDCNLALRMVSMASKKGSLEIVKIFLNDESIDPTDILRCSVLVSAEYGHLEIVKFLIKDNRVNPADNSNYAISFAYQNKHFQIVHILWKIKSVKNTLEYDNEKLYNKLIQLDKIKEKVESF